ncbi:hypothetical protein [Microvirga tunisiensis]|nr:hypothetical protein [Microvirga tunisiensis]MPR09234.1 response regulator [Microvirga tunisiensis]
MAEKPDLVFYHFTYGYFSMLAFVVPFTRWILVRRFGRELRALVARLRPGRLDLVGHSFGTHLIGWTLRGLRPDENIQIDTLIFAGSVLRSGFFWADLIPARVCRVINDCGTGDTVLLASQFLVPLTGMAGRTGFVGMNGPEFTNRYSTFGHSGYFQDQTGKATDEYMRLHWVPLLMGEAPVQQFDMRLAPTAWRGLGIWITNNFEPLKIILMLSPILAALIWVGALYIEANAAKERMEAVVDLGEAMKSKDGLSDETVFLLDTMQRALEVPLRKTYVIWLDDDREVNARERSALRKYGLCFSHVETTADAVRMIEASPDKISLVISDFRRDRDPQAGYGFLDEIKRRNLAIPFIFYIRNYTPEQADEARRRGASAEVSGEFDLTDAILNVLNPDNVPASRAQLIWQELYGCSRF